jgi:hypothetical protein
LTAAQARHPSAAHNNPPATPLIPARRALGVLSPAERDTVRDYLRLMIDF